MRVSDINNSMVSHIDFLCIKNKEPLTRPYVLSFGTIRAFESVFVYALGKKKILGIGESTLLPGYSPETQHETFFWCKKNIERYKNVSPEKLYKILKKRKNPGFKQAALIIALESYLLYGSVFKKEKLTTPIIGTALSHKHNELKDEIGQLCQKYSVIKVKVGKNCIDDADRVNFIQKILKPGVFLRIDGNGGYRLAEAEKFIGSISPKNVQCIEQPLSVRSWGQMAKLNKMFPKINFMLDESIRTESDIDKAVSLECCQYIKLKLFKCGSIDRMISLAEYANKKGLKIIIGNGVQQVVGALWEAFVYNELKRRGIEVSDTELTGPLKMDRNMGTMFSEKDSKLTFYPKKILQNFQSGLNV